MGSTLTSLHPYFDSQLSLSPLALDPANKEVPWTILMPKAGSLEDASFGEGRDTSTMTLVVYDDLPAKGDPVYDGGLAQPGEGLQYAVRYILGYSFRDTTTGALRRVVPMRHPRWYWQRCVAITSLRPLVYGTKYPPGTGHGPVPTGKFYTAVCRFATPQYEVKGDVDVTREYERYVIREEKPHLELMNRDVGTWFYDNSGPPKDRMTTVGPGQKVFSSRVILNWMQVPDTFLFMGGSNNYSGTPFGTPTNLKLCLGCVNGSDWMGYAKETLLFLDYDIRPVVLPINPADVGMAGAAKLWGRGCGR